MQRVFRFLFSLKGRVSRRAYLFYWFAPAAILQIALSFAPVAPGPDWINLAFDIALLAAFLVPELAISVRRFHDSGMSGWWYALLGFPIVERIMTAVVAVVGSRSLPLLLPEGASSQTWVSFALHGIGGLILVGAWWCLYRLLLGKGDAGANMYGPDPLAVTSTKA